jgi:antitoxin CptB|tara:strand:- start:36 stop:311 length:276 start_codon:yes stop_codon:yes gene_type:complete
MYNTVVMTDKLEILKKRLIYRASYRGTKEMDILLSSFVNKYINRLDIKILTELERFLDYEDDVILNFYNYNKIEKNIDKNKISKLFKSHKI